MPSPARDASSYRMTWAQAEWLRLADADGVLPRDWPSGHGGRCSGRRVDIRVVFGCLRQGWVAPSPRLTITDAGRMALAAYGGSGRARAWPDVTAPAGNPPAP